MNKKFACADFTFPLLPHDAVLDLIALLGMKGVDIGLFENRSHLWPSKVFRNISKSAAELARKLDDRGLKPADIFLQPAADFVSPAPNHPDPKIRRKMRDLFERTVDFTAGCKAKHISALPGVHFEEEPRQASLQRCSEELAWRCETANKVGITFSVEAHIGSIVPSPKEALELIEMTPGLTLTLDYTHFTRIGLPDKQIEPLIQHASHFHVRGGCEGRLQASFKQNTIDYARVLKVMNDTGYKGYLGIEYVWIDWEHCNEVDNLSETIQFRDFLKSVKV